MKWFKHETSDRNKIESKLIKAKFGAEGYGIYLALLEVIGEFIEEENMPDWGHVDSMHDINTLAEECCTTPDKLREFLKFCDEKNIFQKHDGRLFSPLITKRLDEFTERTKKRFGVNRELIGSESGKKRREEKRIKENRIEDTTALKNHFWQNELLETLKKAFPNRDYDLEFNLMVDWWKRKKGKLPQNISAFKNWLANTKPLNNSPKIIRETK